MDWGILYTRNKPILKRQDGVPECINTFVKIIDHNLCHFILHKQCQASPCTTSEGFDVCNAIEPFPSLSSRRVLAIRWSCRLDSGEG